MGTASTGTRKELASKMLVKITDVQTRQERYQEDKADREHGIVRQRCPICDGARKDCDVGRVCAYCGTVIYDEVTS